jgi:hypothetical protein
MNGVTLPLLDRLLPLFSFPSFWFVPFMSYPFPPDTTAGFLEYILHTSFQPVFKTFPVINREKEGKELFWYFFSTPYLRGIFFLSLKKTAKISRVTEQIVSALSVVKGLRVVLVPVPQWEKDFSKEFWYTWGKNIQEKIQKENDLLVQFFCL